MMTKIKKHLVTGFSCALLLSAMTSVTTVFTIQIIVNGTFKARWWITACMIVCIALWWGYVELSRLSWIHANKDEL